MAQKAPNSVEVLDIQFKLHSKKKVCNVGEDVSENINLIAVSSAQGLLFAGDLLKPELKVFMLNNLIDPENICPEVLARVVPLPGVPSVVATSCDGSMLAISYLQNGSSFLQIYNVKSFLTANITTLHNIPLSPDGNTSALQVLWNPVISANLAIVLSNGALGMYTLKDGGQYEMHSLDKSQCVQCGCWSPKGKQIVLGFPNGKLQQFKPDLTPAKTIPCPPGIHAGPFSTIAIHWLSTFQFAAAFVQDAEDMTPSLYIINAPKGGTPSYINYFDICYTTGQRPNQMSFTHVQQWNLLLVTSSNGIEMGLLGCREGGDTPTWVQYTLLDEARIELPLTESKDETFPAGFALDTSCTHQLIINEKQLPIMPMIHVLSTHGQLLSFNFLNLMEGAVDICSPPPPISYNTQQYRPLDELLEATATATTTQSEAANSASRETGENVAAVGAPKLVSSTPLIKDKPPQFFGNIVTSTPQPAFPQSAFGNLVQSTMNPTQNPIAAVKPTTSAFTDFGFGGNGNMQFGGLGGQQQPLQVKSETTNTQQQQQLQHQPQKPQQPQQPSMAVVSAVKSSELNKPLYTVPPNFTPPTTTANTQQTTTQKSQVNAALSSKVQTGFLELIAVQINAFDKEIKQLSNQSKGLLKNLGNPDEMKVCTKRLNDLQEIIEQANDREFEMDVQNLRHFLNEARSMIAECRWKLEKYNNPDLPRLGNNTTDPVNRRQLVKLQSYLATNETQMQLVRQQIDAQWSNLQDSVRRNTKSQIHIPCLDGIYERMTKMQETLTKQRHKINHHKFKLQQNGLLYKTINNGQATIGNIKGENTIDSLADSILSMTLAPVVDENRSKLSSEKLNAIREFTQQRQKVNIITAQRPNRIGLNSEVILETILQSERNKAREANAKVEQIEQKANTIETKAPALPKPTASKPLLVPSQPQTMSSFSFNNTSSSFVKATEVKPNIAPNLNFKPQLAMGGFTLASTNTELGKLQANTTEEETPAAAAQIPISFAAKVIGGTNALAKSATTTFAPTTTASGVGPGPGTGTGGNVGLLNAFPNQPKTEEPAKPFSFNQGAATTISSSGFFSGLAATTKPSFDVKSGGGSGFNGSFSFGGFTSNIGSGTTTTTPSNVAAPVVATATASTALNTTKSAATIFSGFGKSVGVEGQIASPLNLTATIPTSSALVQNLTKSSAQAVTPSTAATIVTSTATADTTTVSTPDLTTTDPSDALFGNVNICKPTTKAPDANKPAASNLFTGLGTGTAGTTFSFAPVSGSSFSFTDLSKFLSTTATTLTTTTATSAVSTPATAPSLLKTSSTATLPTTVTSTTNNVAPTPEVVKPTDFSFSLSGLSTSVITSTTDAPTATLPSIAATITAISTAAPTPPTVVSTATAATTGVSILATTPTAATTTIAPTAGIFANAAVTSAVPPATTQSIFSGGTSPFFTSTTAAVTTTTTTVSNAGSIFGVAATSTAAPTSLTSTFGSFGMGGASSTDVTTTPTSGASIFAAAAANTAPTSPSSGSIFGGIPKPDQSVFGGNPAQAPPPAATGASIFANTSPFGNTATSPPPNQTVTGGGIFGGNATFAKPGGTIFGGNTAVAAAPTGSPFGAAVPGTPATGGSIFGGGNAAKPVENASIFGGAAAQPPVSAGGGSIFGQSSFPQPAAGNTPPNNLFANAAAATAPQSGFGNSGSIFGGNAAAGNSGGASGGSIFGGGGASVAQSSFGSPANATATGFGGGAFSQSNVSSPFNTAAAGNSPFGQGGASMAQSGFGSPQQQSAFSKPVFGGPATFGSPPAFGGQPTFGGGATFGNQKGFGSFSSPPTSPPTGMFAAAAQKNTLFETLGSSDTGLSFGNLAQGANANAPKPTFGGSSFTSYRS